MGVFSGWGGAPNGKGGLFRTADRGLTWTKLTGTQFDRVTSLTFNPQNLHQAYLTTETQGLSPELQVWPNPAGAALNISLGNFLTNESARIIIYDAMGRMVWHADMKDQGEMLQINTSGWLPGMYTVQCGTRSAWFIKW